MHTDEKTEWDPSAAQGTPARDTPAPQADDVTELQRLPVVTEVPAVPCLPFGEQATVALPDATQKRQVPAACDPPTVALPDDEILNSRAPSRADYERTELTPGPQDSGGSSNVPPNLEALTVPDTTLATAQRLGPALVPGYVLIDLLGIGTYGEVWLAQEVRTGIRVAIKFLNHDTDIEWQLIQAEVKQLALLHADPGIVQLLDVELETRPPYYIMAYAELGSLRVALNRDHCRFRSA